MKVLISAPIGGQKQYSIMQWFDWIVNQSYDNIEVCICVNGKDRRPIIDKLEQTVLTKNHKELKLNILELTKSEELSVIQKITYSREKIRRFAIENNFDYIFFLDTDTIPAFKDSIKHLIERQLDVVSGVYFYKNSKVPVVLDYVTNTNFSLERLSKAVEDGKVVRSKGFGFGLLLLSNDAFANCEFDYAQFGEERTDDFGYCHVLEKAGFELWCEPLIIAKHITEDNKFEKINEMIGFSKD